MESNAQKNIKLNSHEVSSLWSSIKNSSMVLKMFTYFIKNVGDNETKKLLEFCMQVITDNCECFINLLKKDNFPVPIGTTPEDVDADAERVFTDDFYVIFIKEMARFAAVNSTLALTDSSRAEVRQAYNDYLTKLIEIDKKAAELLFSKGLAPMPPKVKYTKEVEFIEGKKFFTGFFGEKRPLSVFEARQLFQNAHSNELGKVVMKGFGKITKSEEIQDYFLKGYDLADKYVKQFSDKLIDGDITPPPSLLFCVVDAPIESIPFSDSLMLNYLVILNSYGLGNYGLALAQSQRNDLSVMYSKIMIEVGMYANNGVDLLIKNGWLEQPPLMEKHP